VTAFVVVPIAGSSAQGPGAAAPAATAANPTAAAEARALHASRKGTPRGHFPASLGVFFPTTLALFNLDDPDTASVDLPLYTGWGPDGRAVRYILTEASDFEVARQLGVNFAPKLAYGVGTGGDQRVTLRNGRMVFRGAVDFRPRRTLVPGTTPDMPFPPSVAQPGGVGDAEWSGLVVLPSGVALNVMVVANATGFHDRANQLDYARATVNYSLADGYQGGDQFYYHLVTESSDAVAATIEQGVWSPRLGLLPGAGGANSARTARLGFAPTANGPTGVGNPQRQGLNSTIVDDDRAPNNVFPIDPDNRKRTGNDYSPMWDAHVYVWTPEAVAAGERRAVNGVEDLAALKGGRAGDGCAGERRAGQPQHRWAHADEHHHQLPSDRAAPGPASPAGGPAAQRVRMTAARPRSAAAHTPLVGGRHETSEVCGRSTRSWPPAGQPPIWSQSRSAWGPWPRR
jgi:hypothetical protein